MSSTDYIYYIEDVVKDINYEVYKHYCNYVGAANRRELLAVFSTKKEALDYIKKLEEEDREKHD